MVLSILADARAVKMATGIVSVFPGIAPASVTVAPNSPRAFAQHRITEAMSPFNAKGKVIREKACQGEDPRDRATDSYLGEISSSDALINRVARPAIVANWARTMPGT